MKLPFYFKFSGGYIFFETSLLAAPILRVDDITVREGQNAYLESPVLGSTGADGKCIGFRYIAHMFIIINLPEGSTTNTRNTPTPTQTRAPVCVGVGVGVLMCLDN